MIGVTEKKMALKFHCRFLLKCSPLCYFYIKVMYNKSNFILTVPLSILFFLCSQSTYYNRLDRHLTSSLLSTVHRAVTQILLSIVNFKFHHAATQILVSIVKYKFHHAATQILVTAPNL